MTGREKLINRIWRGSDPFAHGAGTAKTDFHSWNAGHPYLSRVVDHLRPEVIVEVGVWKGGSTITMAKRMKELGLMGAVLSVDTFLGSSEHWLVDKWHAMLPRDAGHPTLYDVFRANVFARGLEGYVVPLPLDSRNAAAVFAGHELVADALHIDGGHDFEAVTSDLRTWWPLLRKGGVLIGDDYYEGGEKWPEVRDAVQTFFGTAEIESTGGKCWIVK